MAVATKTELILFYDMSSLIVLQYQTLYYFLTYDWLYNTHNSNIGTQWLHIYFCSNLDCLHFLFLIQILRIPFNSVVFRSHGGAYNKAFFVPMNISYNDCRVLLSLYKLSFESVNLLWQCQHFLLYLKY